MKTQTYINAKPKIYRKFTYSEHRKMPPVYETKKHRKVQIALNINI